MQTFFAGFGELAAVRLFKGLTAAGARKFCLVRARRATPSGPRPILPVLAGLGEPSLVVVGRCLRGWNAYLFIHRCAPGNKPVVIPGGAATAERLETGLNGFRAS